MAPRIDAIQFHFAPKHTVWISPFWVKLEHATVHEIWTLPTLRIINDVLNRNKTAFGDNVDPKNI